jgi:hypothetical protein
MAETTGLVHEGNASPVDRAQLMSCKLFLHNPMLLMSLYHVSSSVSADVFRLLVRAMQQS